MPRPDRLVVVADAHIAAGPQDRFVEDGGFARFLGSLAEEPAGTRLLLLGDLLDFSLVDSGGSAGRMAVDAQSALDKLARIEQEHGAVFDALHEVLAAGVAVDVVPGNHDLELLLPPVWEEFRGRLARERAVDLALHPWMYRLPGLVYAEHGHQHHEVNRVPDLLRLSERDAVPVPAGTAVGEFILARRERHAASAALALARRLARAARDQARPSVAARANDDALAVEAERWALPVEAVAAVHGRVSDGLGRAFVGTAVRLVAARAARGSRTPYMQRAMADVDQVLREHGAGVPFYVTGHTHVPVDVPLGDGARYLNPGTWSTYRPPGVPTECAYVEILAGGEARLVTWQS